MNPTVEHGAGGVRPGVQETAVTRFAVLPEGTVCSRARRGVPTPHPRTATSSGLLTRAVARLVRHVTRLRLTVPLCAWGWPFPDEQGSGPQSKTRVWLQGCGPPTRRAPAGRAGPTDATGHVSPSAQSDVSRGKASDTAPWEAI